MTAEKQQELEIRKTHDLYWESYIKGDITTLSNLLDDHYSQIGSVEEEVFFSKPDAVKFVYNTINQVLGKVEMRNRQTNYEKIDDAVIVLEQCDLYVIYEGNWTFYSKFRASTLMKKKAGGWKIIHQHSSLPDSKTQEGENIAIAKISEENLLLQQAIKRRTIELENKNRELAIEAALEKVRAIAMGMKKPEDMLNVCQAISDQLQDFGVQKIRNVQIAIIDENIGQYLCYQFFTPYNNTAVEKTDYLKSTIEHEMVKQMLASRDGYFIGRLSGNELEEFRLHRIEENHFPDPFLDKATEIDYCFLSIGEGGLGLTLYQPMADDVLTLFKRFHQVFSLAYQRFQDIIKAKAQAREAQIEAALERVRTQTMAMHNSEDVGKCVVKMFSELTALGVDEGTRFGIGILNHDNENNQLWTARKDGVEVNMHIGNIDMTSHPLLKSARKAWKAQVPIHKYVLEGSDLLNYYHMLNQAPDYKIQVPIDRLPKREIQHCFIFEHGFFYAFSPREFQPELIHITKRFSSLFEQTYRRYLDLVKAESQAREAEIELALERVRARTMAMQHSDELTEASEVLDLQVRELGIETWGCAFHIYADDPEGDYEWFSSREGSLPFYKTPRENFFLKFYEKGKAGETFHVEEFLGEDCKVHYDYLMTIPVMGDALRGIVASGASLPESQYDHIAFFKHGFLLFITYKPVPESHAIFQRFAKVFEQTFTRFLDLQKAEAQAKEAKIEAALERVRSRTMAMHHTEELKEVIQVVFEQLVGLKIHVDHAGFILDYKEREDMHIWLADHQQGVPTEISIPYFDSPHWNSYLEAKAKGESFFANLLPFEVKNKFYQDLFELIPELTEEAQQAIFSKPGLAISTVLLDNVGLYIEHYTETPFSAEENAVLMRFGKVFQQTYTRFLDLQKAEAQAREAQIEASLERIRAHAMGLRKSEELENIIAVIFEELQKLGLELYECSIFLRIGNSRAFTVWAKGNSDEGFLTHYQFTFADHSLLNAVLRDLEAKIPYREFSMQQEDLKSYGDLIFSQTELKDSSAEYKETFYALKEVWAGQALFQHGLLEAVGTEPLPGDLSGVLQRFTQVIDLTYTRFLDLQKAEAQAREAQIETALERVRSRTMGMQRSDELAEVANVLFTEMNDLVHNLWTCGFVLCEKGREEDEWWLSLEDGFSRGFFLPNINDYAHATLYEGWLEGHSFRTVQLDGDKLQEHYDWLMEIPVAKNIFDDMEAAGMQRPEWQKLHAAYFSKGYLVLITREPCGKEEIFKRFAQVFDQTYTRFLDLQKAEAQAREAHIEAALEKVRSRSLAMHKSDELNEVVKVLFEKITELQIPSTAVGIQTFIEGSKDMKVFVCGDVGTGIVVNQYVLPYFDHPIVHDYLNAHKKKLEFFVGSYSKKEKDSFYDVVLKLPELIELPAEVKTMISNSDFYEVTIVPAEKSLMAVNDFQGKPLSESQVNILKRFSKVFDQAYIRFLDLQKAEGQAKESQKELSLERIRSQVTSMQESSELLDIVVSMRSEFVKLGHEAHYFWHMRWLPERYDKAMTSGDGKKIGMVMTLPRHIHGDIPLVADWEKTKDPTVVLAMDVEIAVDYIQKMITLGDFEQVDPQAPTLDDIRHIGGLTFVMARTTHGEIGYSLPGVVINPPKDAVDTLVRFAGVFDLAYKRFEDLKLAENDLIEIKAARQKAESALIELKATQSQLVQQEKLASLGQLTAGIAHEIKNPLNFVNNFSEVSIELVEEALDEIAKVKAQNDSDSLEEVSYILNDIEANLRKIYEHGTRANSIVTSMLQHSRGGTGKMEPTDINALVKEFVNLAFHGMRARKNPINVDIQLDLDSSNPVVPVMAEDFSRVILNICNNAFDAMREVERKHSSNQDDGTRSDYKAKLSVRTKITDGKLRIEIEDNGPGIPDEIKDKILQPFFTTKKGTEGTGLGLSITNDIVKAHGGFMDIDSKQGQTIFILTLNGLSHV